MVIFVELYGDLGPTLPTIPNKCSLPVLCRAGVPSKSLAISFFLLCELLHFIRCRAPSGQLDSDEDMYHERRSRAHTDFVATRCEMGVLYKDYGIIGDVIVRTHRGIWMLR